eukprot:scaffold18040_cov19-Tisochrysis_lutea.AAC.4
MAWECHWWSMVWECHRFEVDTSDCRSTVRKVHGSVWVISRHSRAAQSNASPLWSACKRGGHVTHEPKH